MGLISVILFVFSVGTEVALKPDKFWTRKLLIKCQVVCFVAYIEKTKHFDPYPV
jgi:hypothetical protein